ncbi:MAG: DegT/DnrJ/EryC1/StrS aminotransferase family protein [Candidatus Thermoplasmatota archaeon]|nr:DegT/DnrJ/EryC1/StrS aminotransferase family protein [Candidatus Thermoplasmatota archaeon]
MRAAFLPYALPSIGEEEIAEVVDSLRSGWLTSGPKVRRLEGELAAYLGARHALAVSSCTAALHIALTALGIGPGDEVVVPTMTFCSTANVVVHLGARPVLVDVGPDLNVTPEAIEAALTPHTPAIVPVHYGGQPCDLEAIHALAARHGLPIVEDAAHAIGARYRDQKIGSDALAAPRSITCFSFYAIKNMTTGEGGAIATADDGLAETMRLLTLHGMSRDAWKRYSGSGSWYYEVVLPGYKDNMTDIQAALGIHQLQKLEGFIETRRRYARLYDEAFVDLPEVKVPIVRPGRCHVYHLYPILLSLERLAIERAQFIEELRARGIGTSVHFVPVHLHPFYARQFGYRPGDLPCAEALYSRLISLPLYPAMSVTDVADVIHAVGDVVRAFRL